ncbi:hypothetical protein D1AOALGA4SA_11935 [Olavius algarvensis Delta 1 endosymbiont]|nr:hypothetical protein D1AOALGA4SA_11935 [Olavius algarvensis Delta 1 endosymbiont]
MIFRERCDRKRKRFQKGSPFWNLPWAINCDLPQSLKLMAFFLPNISLQKTCQEKNWY